MKKNIIVFLLMIVAHAPAQWITQNDGVSQSLNGIYMLNDQEGWVVGNAGAIYHLTNKGFRWEREIGVPTEDNLNDVCFVTSTHGWAVGTRSIVSEGRVYGRNQQGIWDPKCMPDSPELLAISCVRSIVNNDNSHLLWTVRFSMKIFHSSNSGDSCNQQPRIPAFCPLSGSAYRDVAFIGQSTGWIVGSAGLIIRTDNGGHCWSAPLPSNTTRALFGVYFADRKHGWAVGSLGTIVATTDSGRSWFPQNSRTTSTLNAIAGIDTQRLIAVGNNATVLITSDGGLKWVPDTLKSGFNGNLFDVAMTDTMNYRIVGANGANFYSLGKVRFKNRLASQDTLFGGDSYKIEFSSRFISRVAIFYQINERAPLQFITKDTASNAGPILWRVPEVNSENFRLRVRPAISGKDTLDAPDMMTFKVFIKDAIPPKISGLKVPPAPSKGESLPISVNIEDRHGVSAFLKYRQGGKTKFDKQLKMMRNSTDTTKFEATIDGAEVTIKGIEYFIAAADSSYRKNPSSLADSINPAYAKIFTDNEPFSVSPSKPGPGEIYQMISIPLVLDGNTISQVLEVKSGLGAYKKHKWRLFRWNPAANNGKGEYQEYKDGLSEITFEPKRAFWLALADKDILNTGRGYSVAPSDGVIRLVGKGWHQIANPYAYKVPVASIKLDQNLDGFHYWNKNTEKYDPPNSTKFLLPYEGYFIYSNAENISLIIPPIDASTLGKTVRKPQQPLDWQIALHIESEGNAGPEIVFGQCSRASDQYDRLDWLDAPPPFDRSIKSYISHPDWPLFKGNYRADIRHLKNDGDFWDFTIESNVKGLVRLAFDLDARIPADAQVILLPYDTNTPKNLRASPHFQYLTPEEGDIQQFRLVVGPTEYVAEQSESLQPTRFVLSQNYPNPFWSGATSRFAGNPATSIRYALPASGTVTLKIYNIVGEEVAILLENAQKQAGYHLQVWNGLDKFDHQVPSGLYFYRLKTGAFSETKKMLFIR